MSGASSSGSLLDRLAEAEAKSSIDASILPGASTVRQLGTGANGRCYLMKRDDASMVVHKRIPVSHMAPADQEIAEREVNILATFDHPYIIRYDQAFVRKGQLCIVMEHASGGDLAEYMAKLRETKKRLPLSKALDWFVQLLLALKYVHSYKVRVARPMRQCRLSPPAPPTSQPAPPPTRVRRSAAAQVLHRDIALKNVFLASDEVVKLGDFGVARVLASTQELAVTKVAAHPPTPPPRRRRSSPARPSQVGTPCYISPERCEGRPYSFESDVWAMGCLLYELLTTRPAFAAETIAQVTERIMSGAYSPPTEADNLPAEAVSLLSRMLRVAPHERPSLSELLAEPLLSPHLQRHAAVAESYSGGAGDRGIAAVEIPLIGYEGASKTKFSERPVFVEGGGRIIEDGSMSEHDAKLLGARQRRQKQLAGRKGGGGSSNASALSNSSAGRFSGGGSSCGGSLNFEKAINFGSGGVIGFLQTGSAATSAASAAQKQPRPPSV